MIESPNLWTTFLGSEQTYQELKNLKEKGWSNEAGDEYFRRRDRATINPTQKQKAGLYRMTQAIGNSLAKRTKIFQLQMTCPNVLDLCMAPGGFSATARKHLSGAAIDAVTLPPEDGGFCVMDKDVCQNIEYADITMYAKDLALEEEIFSNHPYHRKFHKDQPFFGKPYDIVICGGAICKGQQVEPYRENCESSRLTISQLVFAMNRLKQGGSVLLLLHRADSWDTVCILNAFNQFSDIQLYKHRTIHAMKSSFYLIAKNVNLEHPIARASISYWRDLWKYLTFKEFIDIAEPSSTQYGRDDGFVRKFLSDFGPRFLEMVRPVWKFRLKLFAKHGLCSKRSNEMDWDRFLFRSKNIMGYMLPR